MTNEERNFIKKNVSFGVSDKSEFPHLTEGEVIPWMAIPNMELPDGSLRIFNLDEVLEVIREDKKPMIYKGISKSDGKTVTGILMVEDDYAWIVDRCGRTEIWPETIEMVTEGETNGKEN